MNSNMTPFVAEILDDGDDDWVAIDSLIAVAREYANVHGDDFRVISLELLRALLDEGLMEIGDLGETGFEAWPSTVDESVHRFKEGCESYNWEPMGALWWLANTPAAAEWLRTHNGGGQ